MPLHIQTLDSQHVIMSLPLYRHPVWCPSGLEICDSGSAEQFRDFRHLCFLTCANFFLLHILSGWKMKTLAIALGFSHIWWRGVTAVALARLPKIRKSWPRTSNEYSLREKGCSHRVTAVFSSDLLGLLSRALLHTALMPPGSTKDLRIPLGQSGANLWVYGRWCVRGGRMTDIRKGPDRGNLALDVQKSYFWLLFPALAWPESRNWSAQDLCSHASTEAREQTFLFLRSVAWIYCFASYKAIWDWSAKNSFIYLFIWWYDKNRVFLQIEKAADGELLKSIDLIGLEHYTKLVST